MSYLFDGTNDKLTGQFASTYSDPITLAAFIKVTTHPVAIDSILHLSLASGAEEDSYSLRTSGTDDIWAARCITSTGTTAAAQTSAVNIDGVWAGIVGKFSTNSLRDIYVQSFANTGQDAVTNRVIADNVQWFITVGENPAGTQDFTGRLAELAVWNIALVQADIEAYLAGTAASSIQAANLIGYWPLNANGVLTNDGVDTGGDLTASGAVFDSDHPTITTPGASTRRRRTGLMGMG